MSGILVPLDGSAIAEQALPFAAALAHRLGEPLLLTRVIDPLAGEIGLHNGKIRTIDNERRELTVKAKEYLTWVKDIWARAGIDVRFTIKEGGSGEAIVEQAATEKSTHIVMTTHAKTGLTRLVLGSVTDYVLRMSPCPLIVIPPRPHNNPIAPYFAPIHRLVVALDGSPFAEEILAQAVPISTAFDSTVYLYRAVPVTVVTIPPYGLMTLPEMANPVDDQSAKDYIQQEIKALSVTDVKILGEIGYGDAADGILRFADEIEADLIAMTTHARTGLQRTVLGSTADRVVREGSRPVLLVRPRE